jgi:hypothetical protein
VFSDRSERKLRTSSTTIYLIRNDYSEIFLKLFKLNHVFRVSNKISNEKEIIDQFEKWIASFFSTFIYSLKKTCFLVNCLDEIRLDREYDENKIKN